MKFGLTRNLLGFPCLNILLSASLCLLLGTNAHADEAIKPKLYSSDLIITVRNSETPAPNVTVCVGNEEQRNKYGSKTTNDDGQAFFANLPTDSKVLITASDKRGGVQVERIHPWMKLLEVSVAGALHNDIRCPD